MRNGYGRRIAVVLALIGAVSCFPAAYAESAGPANTSEQAQNGDTNQPQPTEEVSVEAHKLKLNRLRIEINKAVDHFYAAFNQVNTEPEYETRCGDERRENSYIVHHVCTPRFVNDAHEQETKGFFYNYATIPAADLIYLRGRTYKKRLEGLIHDNPQVRQAAAEFDALTQQFAAVSREKVKGS